VGRAVRHHLTLFCVIVGYYRCSVRDEAFRLLRDSFYVTVGFGVLTVQKLQVRRRELEKTLDHQLAGPREHLGRVLGHGSRSHTSNGTRHDAAS
jgi:hypothetical protein